MSNKNEIITVLSGIAIGIGYALIMMLLMPKLNLLFVLILSFVIPIILFKKWPDRILWCFISGYFATTICYFMIFFRFILGMTGM